VLSRGDALEALARATHVVLDKTGTLTLGEVRLTALVALDGDDARALATAASLEARSEHPIGAALRRAAPGEVPPATALEVVAGQGVEGIVHGRRMRLGRPAFVAEIAGTLPPAAQAFVDAAASTAAMAVLGSEQGTQAVFALGDTLRPGARELVRALRHDGLVPVLLSGDRASSVAAIASQLGIGDARGDLAPADKRAAVVDLQSRGAMVAMAGDGINDAPGLAQAQVSVSLGSATPLAQWTADVVILSDDLPRLHEAIRHARRTLAVVRQNLGWAAAYNAVAIPAAALGFVTPLVAAIGMSLSSLVVVLNALRLARAPDREAAPAACALPRSPVHDAAHI